jgi:hypothetical protein
VNIEEIKARLDARTNKQAANGCWEWTGCFANTGYGSMGIPRTRKVMNVHRLAWIVTNGDVPAGLYICHRCDNRKCLNPDHLFLGTAADNMRDSRQKGRQSCGAANYNAKLLESDVREIRASRESQRALARRFGVSPSAIQAIKERRSWKAVL